MAKIINLWPTYFNCFNDVLNHKSADLGENFVINPWSAASHCDFPNTILSLTTDIWIISIIYFTCLNYINIHKVSNIVHLTTDYHLSEGRGTNFSRCPLDLFGKKMILIKPNSASLLFIQYIPPQKLQFSWSCISFQQEVPFPAGHVFFFTTYVVSNNGT